MVIGNLLVYLLYIVGTINLKIFIRKLYVVGSYKWRGRLITGLPLPKTI